MSGNDSTDLPTVPATTTTTRLDAGKPYSDSVALEGRAPRRAIRGRGGCVWEERKGGTGVEQTRMRK